MTHPALDRLPLAPILAAPASLAVAVSGGVDSLTLAIAAHRIRGGAGVTAWHAVSPAVPPEATARVRRHADAEGMALRIIDAGEFADPAYRRNPVNRCFFCKTSLYGTIVRGLRAENGMAVVASGTNTDDLGDYRPGLKAAEDHGVVHPYVEAAMNKDAVRHLAGVLDLKDVAALPAAPCLSSRVETGLRIEPEVLRMVDEVERLTRELLGAATVRCRVRAAGLALEVDDAVLSRLTPARRQELERLAAAAVRRHGAAGRPVSLEPYRKGSAFLHAR